MSRLTFPQTVWFWRPVCHILLGGVLFGFVCSKISLEITHALFHGSAPPFLKYRTSHARIVVLIGGERCDRTMVWSLSHHRAFVIFHCREMEQSSPHDAVVGACRCHCMR